MSRTSHAPVLLRVAVLIVAATTVLVACLAIDHAAHAQTTTLPPDPLSHQPTVTPVVTQTARNWYEIATSATENDGVTPRTRTGCNPQGFEICGAPNNLNRGAALAADMRYVRSLVNVVYAQNNANGPHTITTGWGVTGTTDTKSWLSNFNNCNGYGLVWPSSLGAPPAGQNYSDALDWTTWPRALVPDPNPLGVKWSPVPYTGLQFNGTTIQDIGYYAWVSPFTATNQWNLFGTVGWWYGCWKYATQRNMNIDAPPQGALETVQVCPTTTCTAADPRYVQVYGWARDMNVAGPTNVQITVDGVSKGTFGANRVSRPDIVAAYGGDATWGFTDAMKGYNEVFTLSPGAHTICAVVPNVAPATAGVANAAPYGTAAASSCKTITVVAPTTPVVPT